MKDHENPKHGDILSIGLTTSGLVEINFYDCGSCDDSNTSQLFLNKTQVDIIKKISELMTNG